MTDSYSRHDSPDTSTDDQEIIPFGLKKFSDKDKPRKFDHDQHFQNIEMARANLTQAIYGYWIDAAKYDEYIKAVKPACLILFEEENPLNSDPNAIVCRNDPPRYAQGHLALEYELVPVWTLYIPRAALLLRLLGRKLRDNQG